MPSFSFKISAPKSVNVREWMWVIIIGVVLTAISLVSMGNFASTPPAATTAVTGCQVAVGVDTLNERTGPSLASPIVGTLARGQLLAATKTLDGGFRQLSDGRWVADQNVTPTAGSVCS